ncbi:MAG TPA: ectonucleotide pyrophosphatase/phosphodiesterase [Longimicrobiales bacterium]|nr:ectonucleotide pyrophosphatase/phosphodiesterase [Longimicrobiales bacterium]
MRTHRDGHRSTLPALLIVALWACAPTRPEAPPAPPAGPAEMYVVMVSFDGLRFDFLERVATPAFDRVAAAGIRAAGLIPAYPSKTFPNHYTLATGLYPGNHGIVDNVFYDPLFDATYALGDRESVEDGRWYGGEPVWKTAERQGLTAASFFWVGSEAEGLRPSYWKRYDGDVPNAARVDTVLAWLDLPAARRPRIVMLYFSDVDASAHRHGPEAPEVTAAVAAMDTLLGRLLDGLEHVAVGDQVNVVLVSDHGMAPAPARNIVYLEDYADLAGVRVVDNTTQVMLYFDGDESHLWSVYYALRDRVPHATVHLREETPRRWHYRDSRRVGEIVVAADPGWLVASAPPARPWRGGGMHGWDPAYQPMHGIFLAAGPAVRAAGVVPAFESVHVHPFVAALLGIEAASGIDGRLDVLEPYLLAPATAR